MAKNGMKVETTDLRRSSNTIEDKTARYRAEVDKIYSEISNLRVSWSGQSSDAFNKQLDGYRNDFQELENILRSYAQFLSQSAERIEKTEENLKNMSSNLFTGR